MMNAGQKLSNQKQYQIKLNKLHFYYLLIDDKIDKSITNNFNIIFLLNLAAFFLNLSFNKILLFFKKTKK